MSDCKTFFKFFVLRVAGSFYYEKEVVFLYFLDHDGKAAQSYAVNRASVHSSREGVDRRPETSHKRPYV